MLRLTRAGIGGAIPSCVFLLNTGNPPPPANMSAERWRSGVPTVATAPDRRSAHISLKVASRRGLLERGPGWPITGFDAPYIWTVLHAKIDCSGRTSATLTFSDFPSLVAYQDGAGATRVQQNGKFEDFMTSGGRLPSGPNSDKLRSKCRMYAFPGALTDPIPASPTKADCERGRRDGFLTTDRFRAT